MSLVALSAPNVTGADVSRRLNAVLADARGVISVRDPAYAATGDGVADDTAAIQAALTAGAAHGVPVVIPPGVYNHSARLLVRNGLPALIGLGGTLRATSASGGVLLAGRQNGEAANVSDCDVTGLVIDGGGFAITGIEGQNAQRVNVAGCRVANIVDGYGILFRSYLAGLRDTSSVTIQGNHVSLNANAYGVGRHAIALDVLNAELNLTSGGITYANEELYWEAVFLAAAPTYHADQCMMEGNIVHGGYYGVSLAGARRTVVSGNVLQNNTRNISVQHGSMHNQIVGNNCSESASSGIHMASGSRFNVVSGNRIKTSGANGEALIQAYKGCSDNIITGNQVQNSGATGNQYLVYIGPKCDRSRVEGNHLVGAASRAGIGVESAWNFAVTNRSSYAYGKSGNEVTDADLTGVSVQGNTIELSTVVPAIFLAAVSGASGDHDLTDCMVDGNHVLNNTPSRQLAIFEHGASQVSGLDLRGNQFHRASGATRFDLPRGWAHFDNRAGNARLDEETVIFANGDASPSVAYGGRFAFDNISSTLVTTFDGGGEGQEILVRLNDQTTLVHNDGLLRLRDGVNVSGSSSNEFVRLIRTAGVWLEIGRSF